MGFALVEFHSLDLGADIGHLVFVGLSLSADIVADYVDSIAEFIIGDVADLFGNRIDLLLKAIPERTHCALALIAEYCFKYAAESHFQ